MKSRNILESTFPKLVQKKKRIFQVLFFVAENTVSVHPDLPLIRLKGVDDTYPPQKKSFAMVKWMAENYVRLKNSKINKKFKIPEKENSFFQKC